jgi:Cu+-exporting ATPase
VSLLSLVPVAVDQGDVYVEVSAVLIAFELIGKVMEASIKKRSSAALRRQMDLRPATALARIVRIVEQAQASWVPVQRPAG